MDIRKDITKKKIEDACLLLLNQKNIFDLSIKDICQKANIGRSTFYLHYKDINDLINCIEEEALLEIFNVCLENINKRIDELCIISSQYIKKEYNLYKTLILKTNFHFENKVKNKFENLFISYFLKSDDTIFAKYYCSFVIHGAIGVVREWILDDCLVDETLIVNEFIKKLKEQIF